MEDVAELSREYLCRSAAAASSYLCVHGLAHASAHIKMTYLFLISIQRLPLARNEPDPLSKANALEIRALKAVAKEHGPGRRRACGLAVIHERLGVRGPPVALLVGFQLLKQLTARVVGNADLVGCVSLDPGFVLGGAGFVALGGEVVIALCDALVCG